MRHDIRKIKVLMETMEEEKHGEYLFIFKSIIFSFAVFEIVKIFSQILKHKAYDCILTPPFFVTFACFLILIEIWWDSYGYRKIISKNFFLYLAVIFIPLIFYVIATLLMPDHKSNSLNKANFVNNYYMQKNTIYALSIFLLFLLVYTTGGVKFNLLTCIRILAILICVAAILINNTKFHVLITSTLSLLSILFTSLCGIFTSIVRDER